MSSVNFIGMDSMALFKTFMTLESNKGHNSFSTPLVSPVDIYYQSVP